MRLIDNKEAAAFIQHYFFEQATDDYSPETIIIPDSVLSLGKHVDGRLIAVSCYHTFMDGLKLHLYILPEYRMEWARRLAKTSLSVMSPIYIETPTLYPKVINFALKSGFRLIETKPDLYRKHGFDYAVKLMVYENGTR